MPRTGGEAARGVNDASASGGADTLERIPSPPAQQLERIMGWPRPFVIRLWRSLFYGILWGVSCFLLYQTMVTHRQGIAGLSATDSPALLAESILKTCMNPEDQAIGAVQPEGFVTLLAFRSPQAAELIVRLLHRGSRILLIADSSIFDSLQHLNPTDEQIESQIKFMDVQTQCNQGLLSEAFSRLRIEQLHILFNEFDFSPLDFHQDATQVLYCLIHTFETLARSQDIPIFLYASRQRHLPSYKLQHRYQVRPQDINDSLALHLTVEHQGADSHQLTSDVYHTRETRVPVNHKINSCDPMYDYDYYHDVFMKSIGIYTTTYRNLYDFRVENVVY